MRLWLTATVLALSAASAPAELEIQHIQAVHGLLGPERQSLEVYPHDEIVFRFHITGVRVDAEGKVDSTLALRLTDESGTELIKEPPSPLKGVLALGGHTFVGNARLSLGPTVRPGTVYTLTVTVKDNLSSETAQFQRKLKAKAPAFAIVAPRFFFDPEGKVPAPAGGLVGQTLYFRLRAIGYDFTKGKIDSTMEMQLHDADGKELLPKALLVEIRNDDAATVKKASVLTFNGNFVLNRAGTFALRVTVTDRLGKKSATFETPLRVTAP
jgi:hypothetical protein